MPSSLVKRVLLNLFCFAALGGCAEPDAPEIADPDAEIELEQSSHSLAEGREVDVIPVAGLSGYEAGARLQVDPRTAVRGFDWAYASKRAITLSWLDLVVATCDVQVRSLYGDPTDAVGAQTRHLGPSSPVPMPESGFFVQRDAGARPMPRPAALSAGGRSPVGSWSSDYSDGGWITQALLMCAGQRALELAQALRPTYIVGFVPTNAAKAEWIIASDSDKDWPAAWKQHERLLQSMAPTKSFALPAWDQRFKVLFEIPASDAAQAATWALIAVDFFRESALMGNQVLKFHTDLATYYAELPDGKRLTLQESVLGALSDALMGMEDAAERAELYVAAATSSEEDIEQSRVSRWRGRFGSRLEAARVFAGITPTLFEGSALVPLVRLTGALADGTAKTAVTTDPATLEALWAKEAVVLKGRSVVGYVYPPSLAQPEGTQKLLRLRHRTNGNWWTVAESQIAATTGSADYSRAGEVTEGYIANSGVNAAMLDVSVTGAAGALTLGVGSAQSTTSGQPAIFGKIVGNGMGAATTYNVEPPTLAGTFPVVDAVSQSNKDRIAEKLIRSLRVSPIQCTSDALGIQCNSRRSNPNLVEDMRLAESSRINKASFWTSDEAYLSEMLLTPEDVLRAALRIRQEAEVLGRAITPETAQPDGIIRVRGTRKDFVPVEPVYLQARTDGATRFEAVGTAGALDVEFARRGIYQTALYLRQQLQTFTPTHAGVTATAAKIRDWADTLVTGYARIVMTRAGAAVSVDMHVSEMRPSPGLYELWVGEDGLECALKGTTSGLSCTDSNYRVAAQPFTATTPVEVRIGSQVIADARLKPGARVYLTKDLGAKRRAVVGFTLTSALGAPTEWRRLPLMSQAVADAYTRTLAADPTDSYRAEKYCNGLIDYDVRVKLEDELTGESALKYSLGRARVAAERADTLGGNVVDFGLGLDERSELARDQLEDLCGATTDLADLNTTVSPPVTPEPGQVELPSVDPLDTSAGSSGLNACLTPESELEWISLGESAHCVWELDGQPPCECGANINCQAWVRDNNVTCPVSPLIVNAGGIDRTGPRAVTAGTANASCGDWYRANGSLPSGVPFTFRALEPAGNKVEAASLGQLALNDLPAEVDRPAGWETAANRCEMLSALYDGAFKKKSDAEVRHAFPWLDYDTVRDTARAIGLRVDPMGRFELTLDGETWLKVGSMTPMPLAKDRSVYDRRYWPGVTTPWPVSDKVNTEVCSKPNAKDEFLYCRGQDDPDGVRGQNDPEGAKPLEGGEREALRIQSALETLAHLTGAEGPRDYWDWDSAGETLGFTKEKVTDIIQITNKDPEGRGGAFGYEFVAGGAATTSDDILFGVSSDDELLMATDLGSRSGGGTGYPVPDTTHKVDGKWRSYSEIATPWNWVKSAGFINVLEEANVDDKFDADEFLTHSSLWKVLRNPGASEAHTAIEWKYHKPRKSKWWEKAADWVTVAVVTDVISGGGLGGIAATDPVLGTIAAANLGRRILSRNVGRWKSTEWPMERPDLFDAFSLVCMALDKRDGAGPVQSTDNCAEYFPEEPTMRDAANAADCAAGRVGRQIDELYIPGLPSELKSMVMHNGDGVTQVLPQFSGQYAEAAAALVSDVEIYRTATASISRSLNDLGYHTRTLDRTVRRLENESKIANIQLRKDIANQVTACVVAGASAAGLDFAAAAGKAAAATATCANAAVQSLWSEQIEDLQQDNIDVSESQAIDDFKEAVENVMSRIDEQMLAVRQAHARVHADIATMQGIRGKAKRAAARATLAWDLGNGRVNNVNAVMRARMNTAVFRYDEAWRQAVRYGFLARKAVEQRFGLELDTMTHRMSLFGETGAGQAPYQWADSICYKRGIDYERIRSGQGAESDATDKPAEAFADSKTGYAESYISDYVTKLEDFIDSYRVDFPFQEGTDSVVVSVRDELQGVRRLDCPVEGNNLLLNTAEPASGLGLWECDVGVPCASLRPLNESGPFDCERNRCEPWQQGARPAKLTPAANVATTVPPAGTPAPPPPYVTQALVVERGRYTASWYERCDADAAPVRLRVTEPSVGNYVPAPAFYAPTCSCANTTNCEVRTATKTLPNGSTQSVQWVRRVADLSFTNRGTATVGFEVTPQAGRPRAAAVIAAPQLEAGPAPTQYFPTDYDNVSPVGVCEDASGDKFRSWDIWTYGCETYCPAGYGLDCKQHIPEEQLPRNCFYETRFSISQEDIERGRLIQEAGFSKGNFNYRIKNVAINFVGTGLKDCGDAELASACYGGSFLQYTLQHSGPYRVRNFEGDLYAAPLFVGKVQMAKGLTAERYLTNPLSSADQNLISTYYRTEFRERPLEGTYTLRVYDTEHLKWSHLEDIQMIVNYDYWTRSPESTR